MTCWGVLRAVAHTAQCTRMVGRWTEYQTQVLGLLSVPIFLLNVSQIKHYSLHPSHRDMAAKKKYRGGGEGRNRGKRGVLRI